MKTLTRHNQDILFCKKVKVSPFTFIFCVFNCCNTSQLMLLTGSRLLKLLKTTKCISTRIFVCLFVFIQLSLAAKKQFQHHHANYQLLLLTGSRLLKLLLTTKCISTRIFVCLFVCFVFFNFLLLQKNNSNIIMIIS